MQSFLQEYLHGWWAFILYVLPTAGTMFLLRRLIKIPDELFRKILHFILLGAYIPFLYAFETWWVVVAFTCSLIVIFFPVLALFGKIPAFSSFVNERKKGEFKSSLVLAMVTASFSITVCWGLLDDKLLTLACVYAWGVGDGLAALAGKRFGKHKIRLPFADPRKSWEGSAAMFLSAVISVTVVLLVRNGLDAGTLSILSCFLIAISAALVTTYVELCTKDGMDTITCPAAAMVVILPLVAVLGG